MKTTTEIESAKATTAAFKEPDRGKFQIKWLASEKSEPQMHLEYVRLQVEERFTAQQAHKIVQQIARAATREAFAKRAACKS